MCDSPYHASRAADLQHLSRHQPATRELGIRGAHVGLDHLGILRDLGIRAGGDHPAPLQHGNGIGDGGDDAHVVLDHEHGAIGRHLLDQLRDVRHILVSHALRRFVEKHQLRLERQRGGEFQGALAPVGQVGRQRVGPRFEADLGQQLHRPMIEACQALFRAPEIERCAETPLQRHAHILENGQVRKHRAYLEGPHDAAAGNIRGFFARDVLAAIKNRTRSRLQKLGEQIEKSRFAGAVRADQGVDLSAPHARATRRRPQRIP